MKAKTKKLTVINGVVRLKLPTASQIGRVMICLASWLLARFEAAANALMLAGTEAHAELFAAIERGTPASFDTTGIFAWLAADGGSKPEGELALAYDSQTDTARVLGKNIDRAYEKHGADQSREFCMALDAISVRVDGSEGLARTGRVLDLKTGRSDGDVWQLKLNAVALARAFDLDSVRACFWYSGMGQIQEWEWGAMDLAGFAQELEDVRRALVASYGRDVPRAVTGEHCGWCRAFASCHAQVGLARALVTEATAPGVTFGTEFAALTPAEAGLAWDRLLSAEALLKHIRAGLEGYAKQQPLQLADGREVRPVEARRESINGKIAHEVLAKHANAEGEGVPFTLSEVWEACPPSCSKDSLKKVLGAERAAEALALIGEAGGIEVKTYTQMKAVKV